MTGDVFPDKVDKNRGGDMFYFFIFLAGIVTFERSYGGEYGERLITIFEVYDGGYIASGYTHSWGPGTPQYSNGYIIRLDSLGDTLWTHICGGLLDEIIHTIQPTPEGGFIGVGYTTSSGNGKEDAYIVELDGAGNEIASFTLGDTADDGANCIMPAVDGYIIAGWTNRFSPEGYDDMWLIKLDPFGDTVWTRVYGGYYSENALCAIQTEDKGYIAVGYTYSFGAGGSDIYVVRTDSMGDTLWTRTYGGPGDETGYCVQEIPAEGFIITGTTASFGAGGIDAYFLFIDYNGNLIFSQTYGGADNDEAYTGILTPDGGFIIAGYTSSLTGSPRAWLIKTDPEGSVIWENTYGDNSSGLWTVQNTMDGGFIAAGYLVSPAGDLDAFIIKTTEEGITEIDTLPPVLLHEPPPSVTEGSCDVPFQVIVHDESAISDIALRYRVPGRDSFDYAILTDWYDTLFFFIVPETITLKGMEYYFTATDVYDHTSRLPPQGFFSLRVRVEGDGECRRGPDGKPIPQPAGTDVDAYRIVSFPLYTDETDPLTLFEMSLGPCDYSRWKAGQYVGEKDVYILDDGIHAVAPGEAYFLIVRDSGKVVYSGPGTTIPLSEVFSRELIPGWNMLGNPYPVSIPVSALSLASGNPVRVWRYRGAWELADVLEPWEGYVIHVDAPDMIVINPYAKVENEKEEFSWKIKISAQCGNARDVENVAGFAPDAVEGKDVKEPPMLGNGISLYFVVNGERYAVDARSGENLVYEFVVETEREGEVVLRFEPENVPDVKEIRVFDHMTKKSFNPAEKYIFHAPCKRHFTLLVGNKGWLEKELDKMDEGLSLRVLNSVAFFYLPRSGKVALDVFGVDGRKIRSIYEGEMERGEHTLPLNFSAPPGIYFLLLRMENEKATCKMVRLK